MAVLSPLLAGLDAPVYTHYLMVTESGAVYNIRSHGERTYVRRASGYNLSGVDARRWYTMRTRDLNLRVGERCHLLLNEGDITTTPVLRIHITDYWPHDEVYTFVE